MSVAINPIQIGLPDPPYLFAAVPVDYSESEGTTEIYRLFVVPEYPDKVKMDQWKEIMEEDKSIVEPFKIIEGSAAMWEQFQHEINYVYVKMLN